MVKAAARQKDDNPFKHIDLWWNRIAAFATVVMGTIGNFWVPPPPELATGNQAFDAAIKPFAKFVITLLLGIMVLPMTGWCCKREHARKWLKVAVACLVGGIVAFFSYQQLLGAWTVENQGKRFYVGSELRPESKKFVERHKGMQPRDLLMDAEWEPLNVWTERSLRRRHLLLCGVYVLCAPIFAIGMLATAQLIYCATSKE
jgi:hypothetical protein